MDKHTLSKKVLQRKKVNLGTYPEMNSNIIAINLQQKKENSKR